jgi:hypothetical protein
LTGDTIGPGHPGMLNTLRIRYFTVPEVERVTNPGLPGALLQLGLVALTVGCFVIMTGHMKTGLVFFGLADAGILSSNAVRLYRWWRRRQQDLLSQRLAVTLRGVRR